LITLTCTEDGTALCKFTFAESKTQDTDETIALGVFPPLAAGVTVIGSEDGTWLKGTPWQTRDLFVALFPLPRGPVGEGDRWDLGIRMTPGVEGTQTPTATLTEIRSQDGETQAILSIQGGQRVSEDPTSADLALSGSAALSPEKGRFESCHLAMSGTFVHSFGGETRKWSLETDTRVRLKTDELLAPETLGPLALEFRAWKCIYRGTEQSDLDNAIKAFEEALSIKPDVESANQFLADCYVRKGDSGRATLCLKREIELRPTNLAARSDLVRLYLSTGDTTRAEAELKMIEQITRKRQTTKRRGVTTEDATGENE